MTEQLPIRKLEAVVLRDGEHWSLRMERHLRHSPDRVWAAITRADQIGRWAPYAPSSDLDRVGAVPLPQSEGGHPADGPAEPGEVLEVEAERLLVLRWGDQRLRYELTPTSDGVRLVLLHTFDQPLEAPEYAAGWHLCLGVLEARLDGQDIPSAAGSAAREYGWEELREQYQQLLQT